MKSLNLIYRPTSFEDVIGQNITTTILKQIIAKRSFKNCYLFSGASGVGKTTCARILARAINNNIGDPIEIDAASNNGVEDIRTIVAAAKERAIIGEYKVYIIDECHSLTSAAWQAFLKCIEECPKYTIFIFCTTEPNKIPATILNRVQKYQLSKLSTSDIKNRLMYICQQEGYHNYELACDFISKIANGGMRDAITALEQCLDYSSDLSLTNVKAVLGDFSYEVMFNLLWAILKKDTEGIISIIENFNLHNYDLRTFITLFLNFILDIIKYSLFKDIALTNIPDYLATEDNAVVQYTIGLVKDNNILLKLTNQLLELKTIIKNDTSYINTIEVYLLNMSQNI